MQPFWLISALRIWQHWIDCIYCLFWVTCWDNKRVWNEKHSIDHQGVKNSHLKFKKKIREFIKKGTSKLQLQKKIDLSKRTICNLRYAICNTQHTIYNTQYTRVTRHNRQSTIHCIKHPTQNLLYTIHNNYFKVYSKLDIYFIDLSFVMMLPLYLGKGFNSDID